MREEGDIYLFYDVLGKLQFVDINSVLFEAVCCLKPFFLGGNPAKFPHPSLSYPPFITPSQFPPPPPLLLCLCAGVRRAGPGLRCFTCAPPGLFLVPPVLF